MFESTSDLRAPFDVASVGSLLSLLSLAAEADRTVLVTGDHGQVLGSVTDEAVRARRSGGTGVASSSSVGGRA